MDRATLLQLTDIETINQKYEEVLGDRIHREGTHSLYNRGILDGMEILLEAISDSMNKKKLITDQTVQ